MEKEMVEEEHLGLGRVVQDLSKKNSELKRELDAWRGCVQIHVKMGGPQFVGFSHSLGQRVFNEFWNPPRGSANANI